MWNLTTYPPIGPGPTPRRRPGAGIGTIVRDVGRRTWLISAAMALSAGVAVLAAYRASLRCVDDVAYRDPRLAATVVLVATEMMFFAMAVPAVVARGLERAERDTSHPTRGVRRAVRDGAIGTLLACAVVAVLLGRAPIGVLDANAYWFTVGHLSTVSTIALATSIALLAFTVRRNLRTASAAGRAGTLGLLAAHVVALAFRGTHGVDWSREIAERGAWNPLASQLYGGCAMTVAVTVLTAAPIAVALGLAAWWCERRCTGRRAPDGADATDAGGRPPPSTDMRGASRKTARATRSTAEGDAAETAGAPRMKPPAQAHAGIDAVLAARMPRAGIVRGGGARERRAS